MQIRLQAFVGKKIQILVFKTNYYAATYATKVITDVHSCA